MEKCSLNTLAKSVDLFIETPFTIISSLIEGGVTFARCKFIYSLPSALRIIFVFSK